MIPLIIMAIGALRQRPDMVKVRPGNSTSIRSPRAIAPSTCCSTMNPDPLGSLKWIRLSVSHTSPAAVRSWPVSHPVSRLANLLRFPAAGLV